MAWYGLCSFLIFNDSTIMNPLRDELCLIFTKKEYIKAYSLNHLRSGAGMLVTACRLLLIYLHRCHSSVTLSNIWLGLLPSAYFPTVWMTKMMTFDCVLLFGHSISLDTFPVSFLDPWEGISENMCLVYITLNMY